MEQDSKRPSAALINREWFEAAQQVLPEDQLGRVLLNACCYVFGKQQYMMPEMTSRAVFAMIKPALDSDICKYQERCARNAANAKSRYERAAASGSEWQRVVANTTTTTTPTPTPTPISISPEEREKEELKEKWLIWGYFWSTGSKAVKEECVAFWSYYESLGWKNNKGALIVSKMAAARMWRRQFETGSAPNGADAWFQAVQKCPVNDYGLWSVYAGAEKNDGGAVVRLRCGEQFLTDLNNVLPDLRKSLQRLWKVPAVQIERVG